MKESKLKKVNIVLSIWASIATIISLFFGYQLSINSKQNIIYGDNNGKMINADSYINQVLDNPQSYSETEILRQAQLAFDAKDYSSVRKLYTLDKVANNATTYNNIGYMYANGLGVEKNVDLAINNYDKAIALNTKEATINKFVVMVNNLSNNGDSITNLYNFTNKYLEDKNSEIYLKFKEKNDKEVTKLSTDYIEQYTHWAETGKKFTVGSKSELNYTFYKIYYWTATLPVKDGESFGQYQIWAEKDRNFELCKYFDDKFIYI